MHAYARWRAGHAMATTQPEPLTIAEAAELVKVDPSTIRRWITSGRHRALRLGPRTVRVRRADLDAAPEHDQRPTSDGRDIVGDNGRDPVPVPLTAEERRRGLEALERLRQLQAEQVEKYGAVETPSWELLRQIREERSRYILGEE